MITMDSPRVAYARMKRDECMTLAREAELIIAPVFVRMAKEWHRRAFEYLRAERLNKVRGTA